MKDDSLFNFGGAMQPVTDNKGKIDRIDNSSSADSVVALPGGRRALIRELPADLETPLSVYIKLSGDEPSFLLESITGGEQVARYSFIGVRPSKAYVLQNNIWHIHFADGEISRQIDKAENPLSILRQAVGADEPFMVTGLPRLVGGLVGYLSYDAVRFFEPSVPLEPRSDLPEAIFLQADTLVAFDHAYGRLMLIAITGGSLDEAEARLNGLCQRLAKPLPHFSTEKASPVDSEFGSNKSSQEFQEMVRQVQEHIKAGDIFQAVLSRRLTRRTGASPLSIYRSLRSLNPSPYMFFFDFGKLAGSLPFHLIGASPEVHVRLEGRRAQLRPIAGTRPRSDQPDEDNALAQDLMVDPKECAEHAMLVDLARNDLGRVCEYGSVNLAEQMVIERYSHVMHIVSQVEGRLRPDLDAFDLLQATFPAGTVSGAPKVRAMQIIHELEDQPRGPYGGVVGYFSYDGSMDTCITLRTIVLQDQIVQIQAGAGIVADSVPASEYLETLNKAGALMAAVDAAENSSQTGMNE
jgi:anthranilate synthase component I